MRKLKFRAWDGNIEEMYDWEEILDEPEQFFEFGEPIFMMQFTGLLDKHGKEIYEGDIVEWFDFVEQLIVKREIGYKTHPFAGFYLNYDLREHLIGDGMGIEIIGNIYEQPELLEKP